MTWQEIKRTTAGKIVSKNYYTGQLTYKKSISNGENYNYNPFGIYVTDISWSRVQINS
jgi:type IV secretory pathway TrbF-like protein